MTKYYTRYEALIQHYKDNLYEGYMEKHHIVPKCLGGTDEPTNLVLLPPKAHYLAHYMLCKIYPNNPKVYHAFAAMSMSSSKHERIFSAKQYEKMRLARSSALKGVPRSEHTKQKMRKPKTNTENYHNSKSQKHRQNISNALKGRSVSQQTIDKVVSSNRKHYDARTKAFLEKKEYYSKLYADSNMTRKQFAEYYAININTLKRYLAKSV